MKPSLERLEVAIVTHVFATGPAQELEEYIRGKVKALTFIGHPFSYAPNVRSFYLRYEYGKQVRQKKAPAYRLPQLLTYVKDLLYTTTWLISSNERFDIYFGADPLNAFTGLLLRKLKKVNKVVMYTIDYVPHRFNNSALNSLYHKLDSYGVRSSDLVWNLSFRMTEAREKKVYQTTVSKQLSPSEFISEESNARR